MLRVKEVSYRTPEPRNLDLLEKVSFSAGKKEHSIIHGDNGSGKTTLLRLMLKLISPRSGEIDSPAGGIAAVFEDIESQFIFSTVKEELESVRPKEVPFSARRDIVQDRITELLGIEELEPKSTLELSYSQKARVVLAIAYLSGKEYMLLDSLPADKKIDEAISIIAAQNLRTLILFMPYGDKRKYRGNWNSYILENSKLNRYNGD